MKVSVNQVAFCTTTTLGLATIGAAVTAASATASTVALVAYSILAIGLGGTSIASITAWADPSSDTPRKYFKNLQQHASFAIAGVTQLFAQVAVQAVIKGVADGISTAIRRAISGPDVVVENRRR